MPSCEVPSCEVLRTDATLASACCPRVLPSRGAALDPSPAINRRVTSSSTAEDGHLFILCDRTYVTRFWTLFEAWISMQMATDDGLVP